MTSWLEQVRARSKAKGLPDPFAPDNLHRPGRGRGYAATALEQETARVQAASNGTRNHTLNRASFSLGQLVAGGELDEPTVVRELTDAAEVVGLDAREIGPTIQSGLQAGAQQPRGVPERSNGQVVPSEAGPGQVTDSPGQDDQQAIAEWVRENLPCLDWEALWADDSEEDWIIEPLLPARRLVALYSPPKVGKSLLMLELAVGISRGSEVLGVTPDRPRRVLYVDFENDPRGDIRERLTDMGCSPADLTNLVYLSFPNLSALDSNLGGRQLMAAVDTYDCEVVVIDTVSRAVAGEENENDTWLAFYRHTGKALKAAGKALVRLDHTGKDETRGQRGGSAKSGDVDAVWRMSEVAKDKTYQLDCEANRMPITEKTLVIHREGGPLRHRVDAAGRSAAWSAKSAAIIEALDGAGLSRDAGRGRARKVLRDSGIQASQRALSEALKLRKAAMGFDPDLSGTGGAL